MVGIGTAGGTAGSATTGWIGGDGAAGGPGRVDPAPGAPLDAGLGIPLGRSSAAWGGRIGVEFSPNT
jgi:hypothetical protein